MCWIKMCKICKKIIWIPYKEFCSIKCEKTHNTKVLQITNRINNRLMPLSKKY